MTKVKRNAVTGKATLDTSMPARPRSDRRQHFRDLPGALDPLMALDNWVTWRWKMRRNRDGELRWTKPPLQPNGDYAEVNDSDTWASYRKACDAAPADADGGIGFCLPGSKIGAIDLDHCRDPETKKVERWANDLLDAAERAGLYMEISPSGTGYRIIGTATGGKLDRRLKHPNGRLVEIYRDCPRYFTLTGRSIDGSERDKLGSIDALLNKLDAEDEPEEAAVVEKATPQPKDEGRSLEELRRLLPDRYLAMVEDGEFDRREFPSSSEAGASLVSYAHHKQRFSPAEILTVLKGTALAHYPEKSEAWLVREIERLTGQKLDASSEGRTPFKARPFIYRPTSKVPPRRFLLDKHYERQFVSGTIGAGGIGKSGLDLHDALAMGSSEPLLGIKPEESNLRVLYWNGEDPLEEIERRIHAAVHCYAYRGNEEDDLRNADELYRDIMDRLSKRLFVNSGRIDRIKLGRILKGEVVLDDAMTAAITRTIEENEIDCCIFDPAVLTHAVGENSNDNMALVIECFGQIAATTDCAVELCFEQRKLAPGQIPSVEDARGASVTGYRTRSARVLRRMTVGEAEETGVADHRDFFSLSREKHNHTRAPVEKRRWLCHVSIKLDNGDDVGALTLASIADPGEITDDIRRRVRERLRDGTWREDARAKKWAGLVVAEVLRIDPDNKGAKKRIGNVLKALIQDGTLKVVDRFDAHRHPRSYIQPNDGHKDSLCQ
jgi:hypothetical protein